MPSGWAAVRVCSCLLRPGSAGTDELHHAIRYYLLVDTRAHARTHSELRLLTLIHTHMFVAITTDDYHQFVSLDNGPMQHTFTPGGLGPNLTSSWHRSARSATAGGQGEQRVETRQRARQSQARQDDEGHGEPDK
jgi:hypothetical protein